MTLAFGYLSGQLPSHAEASSLEKPQTCTHVQHPPQKKSCMLQADIFEELHLKLPCSKQSKGRWKNQEGLPVVVFDTAGAVDEII